MPARLNLVGQRFGRLVVTADAGNNKHGQANWLCRCDCGKEVTTAGAYLRQGDTRSCGCLHDEVAGARYRGKSTGPSGHRKDLAGQRFGRLLVLSYSHTVQRAHSFAAYWNCRCDCGSGFVSRGQWLRNGRTVSCGCYNVENTGNRARTHGESKTGEYRIWAAIKTRCTNPNVDCFRHYGGRGITMCDRWKDSFENFLADMGPRPSPDHSVDRRDNDKGYSPDNCRWATREEQGGNRRNNVRLTFNGETHCLAKWDRILGFKKGTHQHRRRRAILRRAAEGSDPAAKAAFVRLVHTAPRVRCYWCGKRVPKGRRHVDHIVAVTKGGRDDVLNYAASCDKCNVSKSNKAPEVFASQYELAFTSPLSSVPSGSA